MKLHKRVWRGFTQNKARCLGVLVLIFLGSLMMIVTTGIGQNLGHMVEDFAQSHFQEDLSFTTDAPLPDLPALAAESHGVIEAYQSVDVPAGEGLTVRLLSPGQKLNLPAVKEGSGLTAPGQVLLDPAYCAAQKLSLGDTLYLGGKPFTLVGTVALPHYAYILQNVFDVMPAPGFGVGIITPSDFAAFPEASSVYSVRFDNRQNLNAQAAALHRRLTGQGQSLSDWVDAKNNKRIQMPWASITGMKAMSIPLPVFMYLLCCLILGVLLWRTVRGDNVVIGTLYAQGYRRGELTRHYLLLPLALALAGALLGVALGIPMVDPAIQTLSLYYNVPLTLAAPQPLALALALLLPPLLLGLTGWLVLRRQLRKTAAQLMRGDEEVTRVNPIERSLRLERLRFPTKFALRSQLRSLPRLLFLLFGVAMASMLMLLGFTLNHSMNTVFSADGMRMYDFAWEYSFGKVQQGQPPPGAEPFNALKCYPQGHENLEFYVTGIPEDCTGVRLVGKGGAPLPAGQVNITAPLATRLGLTVGDSLSFLSKLDGRAMSLTVGGIAQTYAGQFLFMPLDAFNRMAGFPPGSYSGLFAGSPLDLDESLLAGVKDLSRMDSAMEELAMPMTAMVVMITLVAGLMAMIIIFLVTSLLIDEQRATISLLKVFGYTPGEINRLVLSSSTAVVVLGFFLGIPLMSTLAGAMYGYLGEMINLVLPILISPVYVTVSFVLILGVYQLTKLLCKKKIRQIPMSEALKAGAE